MASYNNFQTTNNKTTNKASRGISSDFTSSVNAYGMKENSLIKDNIDKWCDLIGFYRWFPDLWWDLITPETGGIRLGLDQRVFMRSMSRFYSIYGCFPRGFGKTFIEVMVMIHTCVFFPNMEYVMTAQTRENAASLLQDKYNEIVKYFPLVKNEVYITKFRTDIAEIEFHNGSKIDILANNQSSKGRRRKRIMIEESALLNNDLYEDVLEPIPNVPRRTAGKKGLIDKEELNGQNHFLTTTGFRGSDEFHRNQEMIKKMIDLEGCFVIGSSWQLSCYYERGESRSKIESKKETVSPISFSRNYCEKWVGSSENAFVNSNKFLDCRVLTTPEFKHSGDNEYILGVDVARSMKYNNNQTSISFIRLIRSSNGRIKSYNQVNIETLSGTENFSKQALKIKKYKELYKAKVIVIDSNGLGTGLVDELAKESFDIGTNINYPCYKSLNTDREIENDKNFETCVYELNAQSCQNEIVVNFIDLVDSGKFKMLEKKENIDYTIQDSFNPSDKMIPFIQTDFFVDETLNLKVKHLSNGNLTLEKVVKKLDKDRVSSTIYACWYAKVFMDKVIEKDSRSDAEYLISYLRYS